MITVNISKTFVDAYGEETYYSFSHTADTYDQALSMCCIYASMVEYGMLAEKFSPEDLAFPREHLYQFIQPSQLDQFERMYPDTVGTSYNNALSYVKSYIGNMFDVDMMLDRGNTTAEAHVLRYVLLLCTSKHILSSAPQYSEVVDTLDRDMHRMLKGLKSGNRNMGKGANVADPDVRVAIVELNNNTTKP